MDLYNELPMDYLPACLDFEPDTFRTLDAVEPACMNADEAIRIV